MQNAASGSAPRLPTTAHDFRAIAVKARRDPRTARAVYDGKKTRDMAAADIVDAAVELGFAAPSAKEARAA